MDNPLVSIIIPVYKVERYIERCLLSVMRQECQGVSMECILVDDCTPDDSMEIAERLIAEYEGQVTFHIIRHEQNGGLPVARNTGMAHATGDYLLFVDSDDYLTDDCIRKLTDVVRAFPEVQVVKGNHIGRASVISSHVPGGPLDNDTILELLYMGVIPVMVWNTLIKRSVIVQGQLSFRQGLVFEDNLWSVYLFRSIDFFMFIPDVTYHYEMNADSIQGENDVVICPPKYLSHMITIVDEFMDTFDMSHFVPYTFFMMKRFMQMFDSMTKDRQISAEFCLHVKKLRNKLMRLTLNNFHLTLVVFELLLFQPFRGLMRFRWFRHNYNHIEKVIYWLAK